MDTNDNNTNEADRIKALYENAIDEGVTYESIRADVAAMGKRLNKDGVRAVAAVLGWTMTGYTKASDIEDIYQRIAGRKASYQRTQFESVGYGWG